MKTLKYVAPGKLEIQQCDMPEIAENEVLIKVKSCGICGSDVCGFLGLTGRRIAPMTMGHEFSGEIVKNGTCAHKFELGTGVIVQPIHFCGYCINCKKGLTNMCLNKKFFGVLKENGAMQEYLAVPEKLLYRLPDNCTYDMGALAEPFAVAYGSVKKAAALQNQNVLIIGAGTIGLCILQIVKLQNPKKIIVSDLSDSRLKKAKELGCDEVINPAKTDYMQAISDLTNGEMIGTSFEAVGVEATANQSIKSLMLGGESIWVGMSQKEMEINMQDIVCSARKVVGSFNYTHKEFGEVVDLMGSGKMALQLLISKTVTLEEAPEAFVDLREKPDELTKVIIHP